MARRRYIGDTYGYVKRTRRRRKGFTGFSGFGQTTTMRESFSAIKEVVYTGAIAGAGAIATDKVWNMIGGKLSLTNEAKALAKMATGVALGLVIAKLLKKPKIGTAFAIGPIVVGVVDLLKGAFGKSSIAITGVPYVEKKGFQRAIVKSPFEGVPAIDQSVPDWLDVPKEPSWTYAT